MIIKLTYIRDEMCKIDDCGISIEVCEGAPSGIFQIYENTPNVPLCSELMMDIFFSGLGNEPLGVKRLQSVLFSLVLIS